ncbi:MAG: hypothetical protein IH577_03410, partial [Deltaproteobacteria bacterium]|nr:hypothetical protein [Deltaproteobacteria bacterium]
AVDPAQPGFAPAMVELMLMQDQDVSIYDGPFHNNGVRPSAEDLGRGGTAPFINPLTGQPYPLSVSRLAILKAHGLLPPAVSDFVPILDPLIPLDIRVAANGEFKTPGLRNVELTGPYFHNGGQATLGQVVEFYDRACDFLNFNIPDSDPLLPIGFTPEEEDALVAFLLGLTDERVRYERGPFDHPQLFVPDGHPGDRDLITCIDPQVSFQACDSVMEIPAVGIDGRQASGLGPLPTFLGIEHLPLHVGISENFPTPQLAGTTITFTATPVGGSGSYEFRFLLDGAVVRPYDSNESWNWNTTGLPDNLYLVGVEARNAGSTETEATHEMGFVIGFPPATGVTLTPSPASPQPGG